MQPPRFLLKIKCWTKHHLIRRTTVNVNDVEDIEISSTLGY